MNHLTEEQLNRMHDGALDPRGREQAEAHLAGCEPCRDAYAALAAQDEALESALAHDPGAAYFDTFAARVEDRIRAAGLSGAQSRLDESRTRAGSGFRSPRRLAWIGGLAAVVVASALALIQMRDDRTPDLMRTRSRDAAPAAPGVRSVEEAELPPAPQPAPAPATAPTAGATTTAPLGGRRAADAPPAATAMRDESQAKAKGEADGDAKERAAATTEMARAREVRRDERGEDVALSDEGANLSTAPAEPVPPPSRGGLPTRVQKRSTVEPLREQEQKLAAPQAASGLALDKSAPGVGALQRSLPTLAPGETPLCGEVVDASGRPVAGAQVALAKLGRTASTDAAGRFCLGARPGEHELVVMAVGFATARQQVRVEGESSDARVILAAVDVLGNRTPAGEYAYRQESAGKKDAFAEAPDSAQAVARVAQRLSATAAARPTAVSWESAAAAWERAVARTTGAAQIEARHKLAEARYAAWLAAPNATRASAAREALTAYLAVAPAGATREQARSMRARLR